MMRHSFPAGIWRMCIGSALLLCMLLAGCQTPPLYRGLTQTQVKALKSEGFQETEQGFEFGSNEPILFDFDRYDLKPEVRRVVERIGHTLVSVGLNSVRVYGYTDGVGTDAYNIRLSRLRAETVANELVDTGLAADHVHTIGKGKRDPVGDNRTAAGQAQNRRAAIVVSPR
ncbi:outer membrane protein OmpA-like peptidoglycan-associated protein [Paraburkholderia sp. GAS42]|jgi:outer membrane protein OmpA-like peptidoglycan-associated protein